MKAELCLLIALATVPSFAQTAPPSTPASAVVPTAKLVAGSRVFIENMEGFSSYLTAAFVKKKVPLTVVDDKSRADFVIIGSSQEQKAGWAKTIFISGASHAQASITIKDAKTGDMVYAYNVDKFNAARANQSTAEACAKHIKEFMEKK